MSNWKHAYGWDGHILISADEGDSSPENNVVAVEASVFRQIFDDWEDGNLPKCVEAHPLGITDGRADMEWLAIGRSGSFSIGFEFYGTVFQEAEVLEGGEVVPSRSELNNAYIETMARVYGINLTECRLMIGVSVEHDN